MINLVKVGKYINAPHTRILKEVDEYSLYLLFFELVHGEYREIQLGELINSPLRVDNNPSFNIYRARRGTIMWKDFGRDYGFKINNIWTFAAAYANHHDGITLSTRTEQAIYVDNLFSLGILNQNVEFKRTVRRHVGDIKQTDESIADKITFTIREKGKKYQEDYWNLRGGTVEDRIYWGIYPAEYLVAKENNMVIYEDRSSDPAFVYIILDRFKFYRPKCKKKTFKFRNTCPGNYLQGIEQARRTKHTKGILTKSLKDCYVGYVHNKTVDFLSPHTEGYTYPDEWIDLFYKKYTDGIIILYDPDEEGIRGANKTKEKFLSKYPNWDVRIEYVTPPEVYASNPDLFNKDLDDLRLRDGENATIEFLDKIITGNSIDTQELPEDMMPF